MTVNKIIITGMVTVFTSLVIAATAWNFSSVIGIPEKYVTRDAALKQHQRIENKLDKIIDHLLRRGRDE